MTKLKWTDNELKYFRKGIKSAKQTDEANETAWWGLFGVVVLMEVIFILNIIGVI